MEPVGVVALWLLKTAVAQDAYTRLVDQIRSKPQRKRLEKAVREDTGIRPGYLYRKWLRNEATWLDLAARRKDAYDRLVDSLATAEARGILRRRPEDRARAAKLVDSTIAYFLPTLDPSLATAIADERAEQRHEELVARFDASTSFEDRLELLPAAPREVLADEGVHRGLAERLVDGVLRGDPRTVIAGWCSIQPDWLDEAPAPILLALGQMAQAYGLRREAGLLFEQVADLGFQAPRSYARAAFEAAAADDPGRSERMLVNARAAGDDPFVTLTAAALKDDWAGVLASVEPGVAADDAFLAAIYALALQLSGDVGGAITFLSDVVDRHRDYTTVALHLARLLLERSTKAGTISRQRDQQTAHDLAKRARDVRRRWRGDSREAVEVACQAALLAGNNDEVIALGTPEPDGRALAEEAADPEVQFSVAQAAMAAGDRDTAEQVAALASGFHQALIKADLLASSSVSRSEIDEQFHRAWELAITEENKVAFWLSASMAGVDPMPGADDLKERADDVGLLCEASQHIAQDRFDAAIELLRPNRQSESARRLLTNVYMRMGDVDGAVAELLDMAQRFANVDHRIRVVELLAGADRVAEAAEHADRTLPMVSTDRRERSFLHEVGVAAAHNRNDWSDMERRVRAWINESGPDRRRRWLLAVARFNQADPDTAWRVLQEGGSCEPESALEAQLWITLHSKYQPSSETCSEILTLVERFPGDNDIRAAAVNAFFLMSDDKGDVNPDELAQWQALIRDRADNPDPEDTFIAITVPDDPAGLVEAFRPLLEPQAQRIEEWLGKVRNEGWPYGMLAVAAGRPYTKTLAHRAAGFLPLASPNPTIAEHDHAAALAALEGSRVIADNSAVTTAWYIQDRWPQLLGAFTTVEVTAESRRDAAVSADDMQPRSNETLSWDVRTGRPVLHETDDQQMDRLDEHLTWVNQQISSLTVRPVGSDDEARRGDDFGAWMTAFEAARASGLPLWADDVGLRSLARNEGVATFGTAALLRALQSTGRLTAADVAGSLEALRAEYCVDFPLDPTWLVEAARHADWADGPALLAMSRPTTWADLRLGYELWEQIASEAGADDPTKVPGWVYAASTGIIGAVDTLTAVQLVAGVLVKAAGAVGSDPAAFAACAQSAAQALSERGLPDPTELALSMAMDLLAQQVGPTKAATAIARLGGELADGHREALRRILFGL